MENISSLLVNPGNSSNRALTGLRMVIRPSPGPLSMRLFISLPIFGLLTGWLLPLQGLGGDDGLMLETLFILAAFLLLQGLFTIREWVWLPLNACIVLLLWGRLFDSNDPFTWFLGYVQDVLPQDTNTVLSLGTWQFSELSEETRVLVLLLGWGIMVSAVYMLALYRRTVWLFGGATIVYLAALEAGLEQPVYDDMFRATCFILTAQGLMLFLRLKSEESAKTGFEVLGVKPKRLMAVILRWSLCVILLTAALTSLIRAGGDFVPARTGSGLTIAVITDKLQDWSLRLSGKDAPAESVSLTGYDSLAREMGGPLTLSRDLFFTGETPVPTYWRGEALQYYDGRRWIAGDMAGASVEIAEDLSGMLPQQTVTPTNEIVQKITLAAPPSAGLPLFSGGLITRIIGVQGNDGKKLKSGIMADSESGSLRFQKASPGISSYTLETRLQAPREKLQLRSDQPDPEPIAKTYLQLPDSLPQRVRDLGKDITAGITGRYEMAMAVESYLEQEYTYTLKTKVPPAGRDFTDHFLFDAKEGYCTHFATAMVVLLRTQGIPARYVMGFAPGEKMNGTTDSYRVTQEEAHAWVEVYFPGEGWAAIDPTPGFNAGLDAVSPQETSSGVPSNTPWRLTEMIQMIANSVQAWITDAQLMTAVIFVLVLLPILIVAVLALVRRRAVFSVVRSSAVPVTERDKLTAVSAKLWKKLEKKYGAIETGITIRKYIQSLNIDNEDLRSEIQLFASLWERAAYKEEPLSRTEKRLYLRQCRTIAKKLV
ncbi:DUF3488 and transglutaminase-like domain-containing protein [Paenibacillus sp. N3/727]|uniref:transglutaminase family protein n=1 Tax=Paenibacillus sp. N3/727 TaxID=2925845 RepID=UPI001F532DE2|nr:transglutaminase domain-containing protein [Paenibacillus sp. N3/727]UNK19273.1 DUF3488 and transglutaminase-like domain-containing protein [Paenibacillus sp. N3/727]